MQYTYEQMVKCYNEDYVIRQCGHFKTALHMTIMICKNINYNDILKV